VGIYDMSNQELVSLYKLALKGKNHLISLDVQMELLEAYNDCFELTESEWLNYMANNLLEFIQEEMAHRYMENVEYNS